MSDTNTTIGLSDAGGAVALNLSVREEAGRSSILTINMRRHLMERGTLVGYAERVK